jgi:4-amino-4-deoxy-L-arabinose transferase-like glycosyltransferase
MISKLTLYDTLAIPDPTSRMRSCLTRKRRLAGGAASGPHPISMEMSEKSVAKRGDLAIYGPMVAAALLARLAVIPFLYREWLDPFVVEHWAYGRVARSLITGHGFGNVFADTGPTAVLSPVYAYLLAGIFRLLGAHTPASVVTALAVNSLFSALTCIPIFFLARRGFGDRVAKWAGWLWAFSPYGIYYGADWAWTTCLFTLLLCCLFLVALKLEAPGSILHWIGFGLLCGLAALTEPVALSVVPFLGAWACYRRYRQGRPWIVPGLAATLALFAALSPWIVRNYETFHTFIPVRSGLGLELYIGNNGYTERWVNSSLHPNHNDAELAEYEQVGEVAYMEHKRRQAMDYIRAHPGWFVRMTLRRVLYIWTGYWSLDRSYLKIEPLDPPNILVATTFSVMALLGLRRAFQLDWALGVRFAIVLAFFPIVYYVSHPETYYFRPVDPFLIVLTAVAIAGRPYPKPVP